MNSKTTHNSIKLSDWIVAFVLVFVSIFIWNKFTRNQFSLVDFSTTRSEAISVAQKFLLANDIDHTQFKKAIILTSDYLTDQFLQTELDFEKEKKFITENNFDLYFWSIRVYQEKNKEEYRFTISSKTGEIIGYNHLLLETVERNLISEEEAKLKAIKFLKEKYQFNPEEYSIHTNQSRVLDNRTDYFFKWQKNDTFIPFKENNHEKGGGKLLIGATVSGEEVTQFYKNEFEIPEGFYRKRDESIQTGKNLSNIFKLLHYLLITAAAFFVLSRYNHLIMHFTKPFLLYLICILCLLVILNKFNNLESVLFDYRTALNFSDYVVDNILSFAMTSFWLGIAFLMPALAGESLQNEIFPQKREGSFLFYLKTTFLSKNIFPLICLGYLVAIILLGFQSIIFKIGENYFGVMIEHYRLTQLSTNYFPALSALVIALKASIEEEITYRVFGISLGRKLFKNTFIAVLIPSIIWGLAHSGYYVFPMWFRVFEISCLGLILSFVYLRFGLISVLVAHFIFDVFWQSSGYWAGKVDPVNFYFCLILSILPLSFGLIAWIINKKPLEKELKWKLSQAQLFNLNILEGYLEKEELNGANTSELGQKLISNGWDKAVVDTAIENTNTKHL